MNIEIRSYHKDDNEEAICIWNEVVQDGVAFPQIDLLTESSGDEFFFTTIIYWYSL
jgi:hypothetical protein